MGDHSHSWFDDVVDEVREAHGDAGVAVLEALHAAWPDEDGFAFDDYTATNYHDEGSICDPWDFTVTIADQFTDTPPKALLGDEHQLFDAELVLAVAQTAIEQAGESMVVDVAELEAVSRKYEE